MISIVTIPLLLKSDIIQAKFIQEDDGKLVLLFGYGSHLKITYPQLAQIFTSALPGMRRKHIPAATGSTDRVEGRQYCWRPKRRSGVTDVVSEGRLKRPSLAKPLQ